MAVSLTRTDGFDGAVEVRREGLPPGVSATPAVIAAGEFTAALFPHGRYLRTGLLAPDVVASRHRDWGCRRGGGRESGAETARPRRPNGGWITVIPAPNLKVVSPWRVAIRPGEEVSMKLSVERLRGLKGRVPIDVRNLPQGVRVLDIGLNGVLITENQTERTIRVFAESWVRPQVRPFYAVGRAEAAGTEHSSLHRARDPTDRTHRPPSFAVRLCPGSSSGARGSCRGRAGHRWPIRDFRGNGVQDLWL